MTSSHYFRLSFSVFKGPWLPSSSPSLRIHFPSTDERTGDSDFLMCGEGSLPKGRNQNTGHTGVYICMCVYAHVCMLYIQITHTFIYIKTSKKLT